MKSWLFAFTVLAFLCGMTLPDDALAANHIVRVGDTSGGDGYGTPGEPLMVFVPAQLTINAGDTVTFVSQGGMAHNVRADDNSFRCAVGCDNDGAGGNGTPSSAEWTFTRTFNTPGTINYRCDMHFSMGMTGSITVVAGSSSIGMGGFTSGNWYDPSLSGIGFQIEGTTAIDAASGLPVMLAYWFAYAPAGNTQSWIYAQGPYDPTSNTVTLPAAITAGARFPPNFVHDDIAVTLWGSITFTFTDCNNGTASWTSTVPGYGSGSIPITRLTRIAGTECPSATQ